MTSKGSRFVFLSSGVTLAALKAGGTTPEVTDVLMIEVMYGSRSCVIVWNSGEGMGSREHVVGLEEVISFSTSSEDRGEKEDRGVIEEMGLWGWGGGVWEKELLISSTFFSK